MSKKNPVDVVPAFLDQISARDVDGLCDLMAEDHLFVDGLGNRVLGRGTMRKARMP